MKSKALRYRSAVPSRPPRGGRGLKYRPDDVNAALLGRPPRGGRGLKFFFLSLVLVRQVSPPSRGAWIEIAAPATQMRVQYGRPPRGGRGLKYLVHAGHVNRELGRPPRGGRGLKLSAIVDGEMLKCRPPRGGRGLKLLLRRTKSKPVKSPPSRGAWIEILSGLPEKWKWTKSPPSRGAWIEMA